MISLIGDSPRLLPVFPRSQTYVVSIDSILTAIAFVQGKPQRSEAQAGVEPSALKGSMPPCIGDMELLVWAQRADFSELI